MPERRLNIRQHWVAHKKSGQFFKLSTRKGSKLILYIISDNTDCEKILKIFGFLLLHGFHSSSFPKELNSCKFISFTCTALSSLCALPPQLQLKRTYSHLLCSLQSPNKDHNSVFCQRSLTAITWIRVETPSKNSEQTASVCLWGWLGTRHSR